MGPSRNRLEYGVLCLFFIFSSAARIKCLEITRLTVPAFVPNGTVESVLLDCEYTYSKVDDRRLVVKWFHENNPKPVYQWIPELDSKDSHEKFRVDKTYQVPKADAYTRSRALSILKPTTEMSGSYRCEISSLGGQDAMEDDMIVYALPTSVSLNYTIIDGNVKVVCEVEGVYPIPDMSLFRVDPASVTNSPIDDVDLDFDLEDGAYEVELSTNISESDLPLASDGLTFFGCRVELNGTDYEKEIKVPYFPNPVAEKQEGDYDEDDAASSISESRIISILLAFLLIFLT